MFNPYQNYWQQVTRVNGENGARAYQMPPNSSALLLDEQNPIVWLAMTDGAGYKTVTPYKIEPYQPEHELDLAGLAERIRRLEERLNESYTADDDRETDIPDTEHGKRGSRKSTGGV